MNKVLKNNLQSFFSFFKTKVFLKYLLSIVLFALVFVYSGYAFYGAPEYRTYFSILSILFTVLLLLYLIFTTRIDNKIKTPKGIISFFFNKLKYSVPFYYLIFAILIAAISMVINKDYGINGLKSFAMFISLFASACLFSTIVKFRDVVHVFKKIFPWICLSSILIYGIVNILGIDLPFLPFTSSTNITYDNYFFIYFDYIGLETRNCSIFWEPALFSLFICLGVLFEIVFIEKSFRTHVVFVYLVALATTFSISGFIILVVILFTGILITANKNADKYFKQLLILVVLCFALVVILLLIKPDLLKKISLNYKSGSLPTRYFGPYANIRIMLDHPFGVGFTNEYSYFLKYIDILDLTSRIDSQTCTFGYWASAFGIPGLFLTLAPIILLFFIKEISIPSKISIVVMSILFMMAEPLQNNMAFLIIIFYALNNVRFTKQVVCVADKKSETSSLLERIFKNKSNTIFAKNTAGAFVVKGLAMLISLFTTSSYITYFANPKGDGLLAVWFTILSVLTWILIFDFGVGNGLKNKLIASYEKADEIEIKKLITSSYISTFIISFLVLSAGTLLIIFTDVFTVFNVDHSLIDEQSLKISLWVILLAICMNFVLKIVGNIFESLQKQGISNAFALFNTAILLIYVSFFAFETNSQRFIGISIAYLIASTIPYIVATIILFATRFKKYKISPKLYSFEHAKTVMSLGGLFFAIQICMLLINSTNTLLIQQLYGTIDGSAPSQFTYYKKMYNVVIVVAQLFAGPLWAIIAKVKTTGDQKYIQKLNKFILVFLCLFTFVDLIVFAFLPFIFSLWIPNAEFTFSWVANLIFALNSIIVTATVLFTAISNGLSKLKHQIIGFAVGLGLKIVIVVMVVVLLNKNVNVPWYFIELSSLIAYVPVAILVPIGNKKYIREVRENE